MEDDIRPLPQDVDQQYRTNLVAFASFTVLLWDHLDSFEAKVKYIWKMKKYPSSWLFLVNRYFIPLSFIVNLFAYLSPSWTTERHGQFIRYEGACTMIGIHIVALLMLFRIHGMYTVEGQLVGWVPICLAFLWFIQAAVNAWLLTHGIRVPHNTYVRACTMIFDGDKLHPAASSALAWIPLLYDTIVVALTLNRLVPEWRDSKRPGGSEREYIIRRLLLDVFAYYFVILGITTTLTIMIVGSSSGVKNITAQTELLLTVAMMSRITLSLEQIAAERGGKAADGATQNMSEIQPQGEVEETIAPV